MQAMLGLSHGFDRVNERVGKAVMWLILLAVIVSSGDAIIRKIAPEHVSNAWLELQSVLFGAAVMGAAADVLQQNEHIRIDIFYGTRNRGQRHAGLVSGQNPRCRGCLPRRSPCPRRAGRRPTRPWPAPRVTFPCGPCPRSGRKQAERRQLPPGTGGADRAPLILRQIRPSACIAFCTAGRAATLSRNA